jgi:hypothetical protein
VAKSKSSSRLLASCCLTHKSAKTGRYASEEENGEDMRQNMVLMSSGRHLAAFLCCLSCPIKFLFLHFSVSFDELYFRNTIQSQT